MRAPPPHACAATAALNIFTVLGLAILVVAHTQDNGYYAELPFQDDAIDVEDMNSTCPTDHVLRIRDTCNVDGIEIQCIKLRCCDTHLYISGQCISKSVDPCSLKLCEQACEVKGDNVWCSCYDGYQFHSENHRKKTQPFCVDVNECESNKGGCSHTCINDPGKFHCECPRHYTLMNDGKRCELKAPLSVLPMEPMPLIRAASRCYAPCDTVSRLTRKVEQLSEKLHSTQLALKKMLDDSVSRDKGAERFADGTYINRVLDSTAPLEGGYCRCERGPRGPPGPTGMEGPKGATGARGPRGSKGPRGSLDLMLLLLADLRHDVYNLEARVYSDGNPPERFNLQKAWRHQRKQELAELERRTEQALEAYTSPNIDIHGPSSTVELVHNSVTGEIPHEAETTTDWSLVKGETESYELNDLRRSLDVDLVAKLRRYHIYLLENTTSSEDEDERDEEDFSDYDYSFV